MEDCVHIFNLSDFKLRIHTSLSNIMKHRSCGVCVCVCVCKVALCVCALAGIHEVFSHPALPGYILYVAMETTVFGVFSLLLGEELK